MTRTPLPSPADLRMILGQNLRHLAQDAASISALCRAIGVNRTQFNRYLTGNAFPRPDVLARICQHFDVDANILLRRIEDAPGPPPVSPLRAMLTESSRPFDHYLLPDGMYRYWRRSFRQPERAYMGMAQITTRGTAKIWKGYDTHDTPTRAGSRRFARSSSYEGVMMQQFDGFSVLARTNYTDLMNVTYFEYGLDQFLDYYTGIAFITRRRVPGAERLSAIVMHRLPPEFAAWVGCARRCGSQPMQDVPAVVRAALERVPKGI